MYTAYWKLREKPFDNTPDPRFLYLSQEHEEGLSRLRYVIDDGKGAGMLTGVFGCGKTLLTQALLQELDPTRYRIGLVRDPLVPYLELLRMVARSLGIAEPPLQKSDVLAAIEHILTRNLQDGKESVVIIDDAHAIPDETAFEQVRLLLNFQLATKFLLTILLVGQPELTSKVDVNKQLAQRIAIAYHLGPLNEQETSEYIRHRLSVAGADTRIFTDEAITLVFKDSAGIPRRINQICDMSLFTGYGKRVELLDEQLVQEAVKSLGIPALV